MLCSCCYLCLVSTYWMVGRLVEQVGRGISSTGETDNGDTHLLACSFIFTCVKLQPTAQIMPVFPLLIWPSFLPIWHYLFHRKQIIVSYKKREAVAASADVAQHAWIAKAFPVTRKWQSWYLALCQYWGVRRALGLPDYTNKCVTWRFSQMGLGKCWFWWSQRISASVIPWLIVN